MSVSVFILYSFYFVATFKERKKEKPRKVSIAKHCNWKSFWRCARRPRLHLRAP